MEIFKQLFVGFAISSLISTTVARPISPAQAPMYLISGISSRAPAPEPTPFMPTIAATVTTTTDTTTTGSVDLEHKLSTNWNVLDLHSLKDTVQLLPQLPQLDISSLHVDKTVKGLCSGTDYTAECIIAILPFIRENPHANAVDILKMEMQALYDKANATLELAKDLMVDPATPRAVSKVLDTCIDNYESLLEDLLDAAIAADANDNGRLESVLSATISDVVTCSDAFTEQPGLESPLVNVDEFLKKLCSNVLALSQMINM